jgi:hypothetical protein
MAPPVCEHSFSKALTQVLACASQGPPFSISELHMRVLNRLMCWTPCLEQDEQRKFVRDRDGKLGYERQLRRTPIYTMVCETEPRRSIVPAPLKPPKSIAEPGKGQPPSRLPETIPPPANPIENTQNPCSKRKRLDEDQIKCPQVLLAIRLESDGFDIETWLEWLRSAPAECKDVKIDSTYESFSTLLLVRMPVATWNLLPDNPAYSFVGFVKSESKFSQADLSDRKTLWDTFHAEYPDFCCTGCGGCDKETSSEWDTTGAESPFLYHPVEPYIDYIQTDGATSPIIPSALDLSPSAGETLAYYDQSSERTLKGTSSWYTPIGIGKPPTFNVPHFTPPASVTSSSSYNTYALSERTKLNTFSRFQPTPPASIASSSLSNFKSIHTQPTSGAGHFTGRSSLEIDNIARDHPLYQNATPKADGLYHCPWEGKDSCQHKPEKLKCNYE